MHRKQFIMTSSTKERPTGSKLEPVSQFACPDCGGTKWLHLIDHNSILIEAVDVTIVNGQLTAQVLHTDEKICTQENFRLECQGCFNQLWEDEGYEVSFPIPPEALIALP